MNFLKWGSFRNKEVFEVEKFLEIKIRSCWKEVLEVFFFFEVEKFILKKLQKSVLYMYMHITNEKILYNILNYRRNEKSIINNILNYRRNEKKYYITY